MSFTLIIGGTRSGKSEVAEKIAREARAPVVYVATASASDGEMAERIARHRARRPTEWQTVETPDPARALDAAGDATMLVDGIGPWVAELMRAEGLWTDKDVAPLGEENQRARRRALTRVHSFAEAAASRRGLTLVVAEESGLGLVPLTASARRYLDFAGETLQLLASAASRVELVVAGQRLRLRSNEDALVPAELRLHGDAMLRPGMLDFAVNVVPGGPPNWLRDELATALDRVSSYPDEGAAIRALADRHARSAEEVLPLNGSAEAFWLIASALRPRRAVVIHPTFTEPDVALRVCERPVERLFRDTDDFSLDPARVPVDADLIFLCNPNNPTGTLETAATLETLVRPGRALVVDEAFMEFSPDEPESLARRSDIPGLVVLRSLTKLWSIPAIRAGYLLGPRDLVAALREKRQPWSVNGLALTALAACARDEATPRKIAEEVATGREDLASSLAALPGVRVWPSAGNFLLVRVPDGPRARAGLLDRGIVVRRADTFPGLTPDHLRIAVRSQKDNTTLMRALREVLR